MKLELSNELKSEIDLLLRNLLKGGQCSDNKDNSELIKESIRVCKVLKLIELTHSGKQYQLCEKGILVRWFYRFNNIHFNNGTNVKGNTR